MNWDDLVWPRVIATMTPVKPGEIEELRLRALDQTFADVRRLLNRAWLIRSRHRSDLGALAELAGHVHRLVLQDLEQVEKARQQAERAGGGGSK